MANVPSWQASRLMGYQPTSLLVFVTPKVSSSFPQIFLPECNITGSLYCHTMPPVLLTDRAHIKQMQLDDPVTAQLSRNLGTDPCADMSGNSSSSSFVYHGLLYYKDPKHRCGLHQLKYLKHSMVPGSVTIMTTPLHVTVVFPKHS